MKILVLLLAFSQAASAASWTLDSYLAEVFAVSHTLKQAEESLELSRSGYLYSLASFYLPSVSVSAANTFYSSSRSPRLAFAKNNTTAGLSASLNLFNNFKDKLGLDSARLGRDSTELALFSARQDLTISALNTYYDVLRKRQLRKVAQASLAAYEEQFRKAQAYYKDGLKSYSDVLKSELNFRSSQLSEMSYAESCRNSEMAFNTLVYRQPDEEALLAEVTGVSDLGMPDLSADLAYALANRPDLRQARLSLEQKKIARKEARIGWLPNLSADASYSRQGLLGLGDPAPGALNHSYSAGVSLSLPLGVGTLGVNNSNLSAEIELARSQRSLLSDELAAKKEIISAWHSRALALKSYEVAKMQAEISAENLAIVKEKYSQGRAGIIELNDAQSDELSAQNSLANSFFDLLLDRISYDKTVGRKIWR
ncbi:MAG TPA: TolC family protein [Elusimicrobiales bacterium]|nr:TolC family protein [Elusimicrobiales bacterium]